MAPWRDLGRIPTRVQLCPVFAPRQRVSRLLLYTEHDPANPVHLYVFDPILNKTGLIWHCRVPEEELRGATLYAYRIDGPYDPVSGHWFDAQKVLLDPFALSVYFPPEYSRSSASKPGPTDGMAPLGRLLKDPVSLRLGCGPPSPPRPRSHRLRAPRQRVHRTVQLGSEPGKTRDLCRAYGEDSLSQRPRNHRSGTPSRPSVRSSGGQLLGLHDPQFLLTPP